jgi:peptidylprolyl isomerase
MKTKKQLLTALFLCLAAALPATAQQPVSVHIELGQHFYYEDGSLQVRISVRNNGDTAVPNPIEGKLFKSFQVRSADGSEVKASGKPDTKEPSRPAELAPLSFYGATVDLTRIFPELNEVGTYTINWSANGLLSERLTVKIIPAFDSSKAYEATVRTNHGAIVLNFFPEHSPIAVKAFFDMTNAGFYNGLQFHEVRPDTLIVGGSAVFAQSGAKPFIYPAESSALPLVAGTVAMKPAGASPPANGSEFMILLRPQQGWAGQLTVLGNVVSGLDVVRTISRLPNSGQVERPFFRPKEAVTIESVTIREKGAPSGVSAPK